MCPVERVRVRVRRLVRSLPLAGRGTLSLFLPLALHKHVKLTAAHEEQLDAPALLDVPCRTCACEGTEVSALVTACRRGTLSLSLPLALHKHVKLTAAHEEQEVDPVFDENVPALHDLQTLLLVAP